MQVLKSKLIHRLPDGERLAFQVLHGKKGTDLFIHIILTMGVTPARANHAPGRAQQRSAPGQQSGEKYRPVAGWRWLI